MEKERQITGFKLVDGLLVPYVRDVSEKEYQNSKRITKNFRESRDRLNDIAPSVSEIKKKKLLERYGTIGG